MSGNIQSLRNVCVLFAFDVFLKLKSPDFRENIFNVNVKKQVDLNVGLFGMYLWIVTIIIILNVLYGHATIQILAQRMLL